MGIFGDSINWIHHQHCSLIFGNEQKTAYEHHVCDHGRSGGDVVDVYNNELKPMHSQDTGQACKTMHRQIAAK